MSKLTRLFCSVWSDWTVVDVLDEELDWTELEWTELNWTLMDWTLLDWVSRDWTKFEWTELDVDMTEELSEDESLFCSSEE